MLKMGGSMRFFAAALLVSFAACSQSDSTSPPAGRTAEVQGTEGKPAESPPTKLDAYRLTGPRRRGNLAVYLIHEKNARGGDLDCLVLEEAVRSGALKISEKGEGAEVNELQIENTGEKPVYLQAGDTVKGGQQDRTIAVDFILPPKSGKRTVDAFCVEPGRWSTRSESPAGSGPLTGATFGLAAAPTPVASKEQKLAVRLSKDQSKVWEAGEKVNRDLKVSKVKEATAMGLTVELEEAKNSYVEAVEDPGIAKKVDEAVADLVKIVDGQPEAVGAAFCVNGTLQNAEIYSATGLFRKLWPKLLRAAVVEALAKSADAAATAPPSAGDLEKSLAAFSGQEGRTEARPDGPVVRIFEKEHAVLFDTEHQGALLHRQLLTK
jgi:hypothetical protein